MNETKVEEYVLDEDQELRFEVEDGEVLLELIDGKAEIFGTELILHRKYPFQKDASIGVFTWHGCKLELVGHTKGAYVSKLTPMVMYCNTHAALEQLREQAELENIRGPRLMVVGPTLVGKSTLCRILLNYAARLNRCPIYVDLDVCRGYFAVPGSIGSLFIERPADPVEGFDKRAPLVFHFGHVDPASNVALYNVLVSRLAQIVNAKTIASKTAGIGGLIIDTIGVSRSEEYRSLLHAAQEFQIDVVVVFDDERLYYELQKDLPEFVKIVHFPKSQGVHKTEIDFRHRMYKIKEYFYGTPKQPCYPHSFDVKFHEVLIFEIGAPVLPESCMPLGMKAEDTRLRVVRVQPSEDLKHRVLAVSLCEVPDHAEILHTNVAGFIVITEVDMSRQALTILSPQPYPLPRHILILSDILYLDSIS